MKACSVKSPITSRTTSTAIARDLAMDHTETEIGGERLIYRCQ